MHKKGAKIAFRDAHSKILAYKKNKFMTKRNLA